MCSLATANERVGVRIKGGAYSMTEALYDGGNAEPDVVDADDAEEDVGLFTDATGVAMSIHNSNSIVTSTFFADIVADDLIIMYLPSALISHPPDDVA